MTISVPSPLSMPLDVKVKHTKDGKVSGYELSRPARIGVQSEFTNYLDGGPWEQTRMQLVRSLGEKSLEFVILERPILVEAVNNGAIDMAVTDAGNFIPFEMTATDRPFQSVAGVGLRPFIRRRRLVRQASPKQGNTTSRRRSQSPDCG